MLRTMIEVAGKRVVVMGIGRFGGGSGVIRWLCAQGADVLATDLAGEADLAEPLAGLADLMRAGRLTLRLGGHNVSDFTTCDLVVANPAVPTPWENRFVRAADAAGVRITTEIAITVARAGAAYGRDRLIGVTGSVGKSTTTAMIAHALSAAGQSVLAGGNLGGSLLGEIGGAPMRGGALPWVVLEVSSAMLWWLEREFGVRVAWWPRVAVATNLSANHMDWHGSMGHYEESKRHLLRHQGAGDAAVLGAGVAHWARGRSADAPCVVVRDDSGLGNAALRVPGGHNRLNAAMALEACAAALGGHRRDELRAALGTFAGLPHRLELVCDRGGVRAYNDSKCTTPEAMLKALDALEQAGVPRRRVHLLVGGYDKKIDLGPVAEAALRLGGLHCLGATGPAIAALARARGVGLCTLSTTLTEAVAAARAHLTPGDCLLLSPASASWDQYPNYEHRGNEFKRLVNGALTS